MIDKIKKIDFLKKVVSVEEIHKGLSNAKLYKVIKDGKEYLLKVYSDNNYTRINTTSNYINANQPIPLVHDYGKTEDFSFFVIMDYISSGTLEENYDLLNVKEIYDLSLNIGKAQNQLNKKFNYNSPNYYEEFKTQELEKYNITTSLINKYKNKLSIYDKMDFDKIKRLFAEYIEYFKEDRCYYMHMDLKADNLMYDKSKLLMIDYENSQLMYCPIALRCELHHIMKHDKYKDKSLAFIKGIMEGMNEKELKDRNLDKKFKFAYLKSAFVYIVAFYLKNEEFFKANQQLEDINNVLKDQNK